MNNLLLQDNKVLGEVSRIHLLRIITLIVKNLKKEDYSEFEAVIVKKDSAALVDFAIKKIPQLEVKLLENVKTTNQKLQEVAQNYEIT